MTKVQKVKNRITVPQSYLIDRVIALNSHGHGRDHIYNEIKLITDVVAEYNNMSENTIILDDGGIESRGDGLIYNKACDMTIMVSAYEVVHHLYGENNLNDFNNHITEEAKYDYY